MKKYFLIVGLFLFSYIKASANPDCGQTYSDTIVNGRVFIQTGDTLVSHNVVVTSTGDLTLISQKEVVISSSFVVQLGGVLNIYGGNPFAVSYIYDAAGNRIQKKKK